MDNYKGLSNEYLSSIISKAIEYSNSDPETSLMYSRKSAEAICLNIFATRVGQTPTTNKLDELISLLNKKGILPEKITIPLRTMQQYGNFGSHVQQNCGGIEREYIDPCLLSLIQVINWYFHDFLEIEIPKDIVSLTNNYTPREEGAIEKLGGKDDITKDLQLPYSLRSYQWEGISFLFQRNSALLADEMGLGKTVQAIIALRLCLQKNVSKRVLIIVPASLVYNWEREFETWAPNLIIRKVMGNATNRHATYRLPIQVLIATYEQIRADAMDMDNDICFDVVILDEAQRIKNHNSTTALACRLLNRSASWVLTGTPLENSLDDLLSIFLFVNPGLLHYGMPPQEIHYSIRDFFLRRRRKDVLKELPPIIYQDITLELSGAQKDAYDDAWMSRYEAVKSQGTPVSEVALFALIIKLKQLCNYEPTSEQSVKSEMLKIIIEDFAEADDKAIIFSQYVETLEMISRSIGDFPHELYYGQQNQLERDQVLERFKTQEGPRALLISLKAGGVGLNIQVANTVILFDRW